MINSEHLRLDREEIEAQLVTHLSGRQGDREADLHLGPAYESWSRLSPAVRMIADGHRLVEIDLQRRYGWGCRAGVAAEFRGRGIAARVAVDATVPQSERVRWWLWAEDQLNVFRALGPARLRERGWTEIGSGRWQTFTYESNPELAESNENDIDTPPVPPSLEPFDRPILGQ